MSDAMSPIVLPDTNLKVEVSANEERAFSYTNKRSGYYYANTHSDQNEMWFAGWNVAGKRLLSDYQLFSEGQALLRTKAASRSLSRSSGEDF